MLGQYLPIMVLAALAILFAVISTVASQLLAPRAPHQAKAEPYECGIVPTSDVPERFPVRFFLVAMIFIVFDVEIIFFFPWTMVFRSLGVFGLVAVGLFAFAVFESFLYLIGNGALEWSPAAGRDRSPLVTSSRTASSTVRRVGLEGRAFDTPGESPAHEDAA